MSSPHAAFARTAESAQQLAGVIAARARGDFAGADALLRQMGDPDRAAGGVLLADLAVGLLARAEARGVDEVASELSLHLAALAPATPDS